jgi:hypothetical protein
MTAYPNMTQAQMDAAVARQVAAGANMVWIGHNNPGEVGARKREPALSYAVYAAYRDGHDPRHADAAAMVRAELRLLAACRRAGVQAVFPVGYQIQMGKAWNDAHPQDLRRDAAGKPFDPFDGGVSASFYSPAYRHDIQDYYAWANATFVAPYSGTIMMVNMADEPSGGDYSTWADAAFRATHHYGLLQAGSDPARLREVGAFESSYVAAYATWSAARWLEINPTISTTMSFDGGQSRYAYQSPDIESLFRDPPPNFAVTFDAYPRDGLFDTPLRDADLIALDVFARALGAYSARYGRPLYLWSAANSWGLNAASNDPGTVADAVANGIALAALTASTGGDLWGIAAWSYNVKGQGVYNDTHTTSYTPDAMFQAVSASFGLLRAIMAGPRGRPDTLLLAPDGSADALIGARRAARGLDPYDWMDLAALARTDVASAVVGTLSGANLAGIRRVVVLPAQPSALAGGDLAALRRVLAAGGTVIAAPGVAAALEPRGGTPLGAIQAGPVSANRLRVGSGVLVVAWAGPGVEPCFSDTLGHAVPALWETLLGGPLNHDGYVIIGGGVALLYTLSTPGSIVRATVGPHLTWTHGESVATTGQLLAMLPDQGPGTQVAVALAHREYALYHVVPRP